MDLVVKNEKIDKYLNELAAEYKTLLFNALLSRSPNLDDLSVSELLRIDNEVKKTLLSQNNKQERRKKTLFAIGLTYMFLGLCIILVYTFVESDFEYGISDVIMIMSLVISIVGFASILFSITLNNLHSEHKNSRSSETLRLQEYQVIVKWRELEGVVNDMSIPSNNIKTTGSVIRYLFENKFINNSEAQLLKQFLRMRNNIVHSMNAEYSAKDIVSMINKVDKIIEKLKKIVY